MAMYRNPNLHLNASLTAETCIAVQVIQVCPQTPPPIGPIGSVWWGYSAFSGLLGPRAVSGDAVCGESDRHGDAEVVGQVCQ